MASPMMESPLASKTSPSQRPNTELDDLTEQIIPLLAEEELMLRQQVRVLWAFPSFTQPVLQKMLRGQVLTLFCASGGPPCQACGEIQKVTERDAEVWQKDWIAEWLEQGEKKGRSEGRREGLDEGRRMAAQSVLDFLKARGLSVSQAVRDHVLACQDLSTLKRYLTKAALASSAKDAVAE